MTTWKLLASATIGKVYRSDDDVWSLDVYLNDPKMIVLIKATPAIGWSSSNIVAQLVERSVPDLSTRVAIIMEDPDRAIMESLL